MITMKKNSLFIALLALIGMDSALEAARKKPKNTHKAVSFRSKGGTKSVPISNVTPSLVKTHVATVVNAKFKNLWDRELSQVDGAVPPFAVNFGPPGECIYPELKPSTGNDKEFIALIQLIIHNSGGAFGYVFNNYDTARKTALKAMTATVLPPGKAMTLADFAIKFKRRSISSILSKP